MSRRELHNLVHSQRDWNIPISISQNITTRSRSTHSQIEMAEENANVPVTTSSSIATGSARSTINILDSDEDPNY